LITLPMSVPSPNENGGGLSEWFAAPPRKKSQATERLNKIQKPTRPWEKIDLQLEDIGRGVVKAERKTLSR
jgi:hypothetical protein